MSEPVEEEVRVHQRSLVEKILARYSGEHVVFRELLQNADDAAAHTFEIHFDAVPSDDDREHEWRVPLSDDQGEGAQERGKRPRVRGLRVRNDGRALEARDWARLRTIADGNPSPDKTGAFGVGFYATFSVSDSPLVHSGETRLEFVFRGDRLVTRRTDKVQSDPASEPGRTWTTVHLPLRAQDAQSNELLERSSPLALARFLCASLGFTKHVKVAAIFVGSSCVARLEKQLVPLENDSSVVVRPGDGIVRPQTCRIDKLVVNATVLQWLLDASQEDEARPDQHQSTKAAATQSSSSSFASRMIARFTQATKPQETLAPRRQRVKPSPATAHDSSLHLQVITAVCETRAPERFAQDFERAVKKRPPAKPAVSLTYMDPTEYRASTQRASSPASSVFNSFATSLERHGTDGQGAGKVFVGFPTFQTTGCAASLCAPFVSTVEREALDFQTHVLDTWNRELVACAGSLARSMYEHELRRASDSAEDLAHVLRFFTVQPSTPSSVVADVLRASFLAGPKPVSLPTITHADARLSIRPATEARVIPSHAAALLGFLRTVPLVPESISRDAHAFVKLLRDAAQLRDVLLTDIFDDLARHTLSAQEARHALAWWLNTLTTADGYDPETLLPRFKNALVMMSGDDDEAPVQLASVRTVVNTRVISNASAVPLPPHTMPYAVSKHFDSLALCRALKLAELSLVDWTRFLVADDSGVVLCRDTALAEKLIAILAKQWSAQSEHARQAIVAALGSKAWLPTSRGTRPPNEAYFSNVNLFDDLPIVDLPGGPVRGSTETVLRALGVRKHVDLQLIFSRMLAKGDWSHVDLARYLTTIELSDDERSRLKSTQWLLSTQTRSAEEERPRRLRACDLYEPNAELAELGLRQLEWPTPWRANSKEASLLYDVGLQRRPAVSDVLQAAMAPATADAALRYFVKHHDELAYDPMRLKAHDLPYVPALVGGKHARARPSEVFTDAGVAHLGFATVDPAHAVHASLFKLARHPPSRVIVARLLQNPPRVSEAPEVFAYLSTLIAAFGTDDRRQLSNASFIPVANGASWAPPPMCFFGDGQGLAPAVKRLFTFVDFGADAQPFLLAIGVKEAPGVGQLAELVAARPAMIYEACSRQEYIGLLRSFAANMALLPDATRHKLKRSACFVGQHKREGDKSQLGHVLLPASQIAVVDDFNLASYFAVTYAPREELLERFYEAHGSPTLSSLVRESYTPSGEPEPAAGLHREIVERTRLFIDHYERGKLLRNADWVDKKLRTCFVRSIEHTRTLTFGSLRRSHVRKTSACIREGAMLLIARDVELDYHEVALALCRILMRRQRLEEVWFFESVLSTSLATLRRRGFDIDKITAARDAEREAEELRERERRLRSGDDDKVATSGRAGASAGAQGTVAAPSGADEPPPYEKPRSLFDELRRITSGRPSSAAVPAAARAAIASTAASPAPAPAPPTTPRPTNMEDIRKSVTNTVKASRPGFDSVLQSAAQQYTVSEASKSHCDSTHAKDLKLLTEIGGMSFYVDPAVPDPRAFVARNAPSISIFVHEVLTPVARVFELPPKSLHVFHDLDGPVIAFNRAKTIYFNYRFFAAWHLEACQRGDFRDARVAAFVSLCHELAHNKVAPHDSVHSFYTESIVQQYLDAFYRSCLAPPAVPR